MIAIFQIHFSDVGLDEWYSNPIYIMQLHVDKCRSNLFEDVYNYFLICFMILLFLVLEEEFISHDMSSSSKFSRHHLLLHRWLTCLRLLASSFLACFNSISTPLRHFSIPTFPFFNPIQGIFRFSNIPLSVSSSFFFLFTVVVLLAIIWALSV